MTPDELRTLAVPGDREDGSSNPPRYRAQSSPKRFGSKTVAEIIKRYEAGESARSLAEQHGVAASALVRLLRENSVVVKRRKVTTEEARRMETEYEAGATMKQLEDRHELSHGAVMRALHRVGVATRPSAPRRKDT